MAKNCTRRGSIMRYYLFFIGLFFCPFLFAQRETGEVSLAQDETEELVSFNKMEEVSALVTLFEERQLPLDQVPFLSEGFDKIHNNRSITERLSHLMTQISFKSWGENYAPGPLFNSCIFLSLSVRCYWLVLRLDRLTIKNQELQNPNENQELQSQELQNQELQNQELQVKEIINAQLSFENFKEEIHRLQATPLRNRLEVEAWFLLLALEFQDWATERGVSDPERLFSAADELVENILSEKINRSDQPFTIYALYRYFQRPGYEDQKQELLTWITSFFLQRNDGTQADLEVKTTYCVSQSKLAGIHRDYLEENGLILPGYEEFEVRTASEDTERIDKCVKHLSSEMARSFSTYGTMIIFLNRMGGIDAVRYFVRHNPIPHNIPFPKFEGQGWIAEYWRAVYTFSILRDTHDDLEWQHQWQEIITGYERALSTASFNNLDQFVFALTHLNFFYLK